MNAEHTAAPKVYQAITAVAAKLCERGVGKSRRNEAQNYLFRGIDDFYNALAPALASERLCVLPRCVERSVTERTNAKGTTLLYVVIGVEFDFVAAEDGSKHTVGPIYGEAMDSGDKATNKALSAAYKYAMMQAFAIPIEGQSVDSETNGEAPAYSEPEEVVLQGLRDAALAGTEALRDAWKALTPKQRVRFREELPSLKDAAAKGASDAS